MATGIFELHGSALTCQVDIEISSPQGNVNESLFHDFQRFLRLRRYNCFNQASETKANDI